MKKINYFKILILTLLVLLGATFLLRPSFIFGKYIAKENITESPSVKFIISNKSGIEVFIRRNVSMNNLGKLESIVSSSKLADTISLPIENYEYIYIGNKHTEADTFLLGNKDLVKISVDPSNKVTTQIDRANSIISDIENVLAEVSENEIISKQTSKIDSIVATFYKIDYVSPPMILEGDYSLLKNYPVQINKDQIKNIEINTLTTALLSRNEAYGTLIKKSSSEFPETLIQTVLYKLQFDLYEKLQINSFINSEEITKILDSDIFFNTKITSNPYGNIFLSGYLSRNVVRESRNEQSRSRDYKDYYQTYHDCQKYFDSTLVKFAQYNCFEMMSSFGEAFVNMNLAFKDFEKKYQDTLLNNLLKKNFLFDLAEYNNKVDNVYLLNSRNQVSTLDEVLRTLKGNVVYVDFWASWCAPCRQAMPFSHKLAQDFSAKNFFVIYLSLDEDRDKWRKAVVAEKLDYFRDNYLVINSKKSVFLNKIKLKAIPRYLLFDKGGKLIHQDAPGPSSKEIRNLILENM